MGVHRLLALLVAALLAAGGFAQEGVSGEVTYVTASSVYVRFPTTGSIAVGDTLYLTASGTAAPCLVVHSKSSTSCASSIIGGCGIRVKDRVVAKVGRVANAPNADRKDTTMSVTAYGRERIRGRLSAASYSTIATERENDHRLMYRLAFNIDRISDSRFSAETYVNYRQLFPSEPKAYPQQTEFFNVYSLALSYASDSTSVITIGRKINNNAASLGAIDGLQAEKTFGRFFAGAIAGSRPDIQDYGLNTALLQYGGYVGSIIKSVGVDSRTTLGLLQQNNAAAVDRRYTYFQNASTIGRNLNLFSSFELDLFNPESGQVRLTNLYFSSKYKFSRKLDVFASYDSRRRIVYYETYRSDVEMLLDDDEARQGARVRLTFKPIKNVLTGASFSKRFQSSGLNPSDNINGYVTFSGAQDDWGRWTVQVNRNTSSYLRSDIISFRHARTLIPRKLNVGLYYRMADYLYASRTGTEGVRVETQQRYYGADLSWNICPQLVFTVLGEMSTIGTERNYRFNTGIVKRFDSRK